MDHLYRTGDMIPQFTCNGFHGCESFRFSSLLVCPRRVSTLLFGHHHNHARHIHTGPSLYTGKKEDRYDYAMLGPYVPFYSEDMPNTGGWVRVWSASQPINNQPSFNQSVGCTPHLPHTTYIITPTLSQTIGSTRSRSTTLSTASTFPRTCARIFASRPRASTPRRAATSHGNTSRIPGSTTGRRSVWSTAR